MTLNYRTTQNPTRTDGEVRWAWAYGAILGALLTIAAMKLLN